MRRTRFFSAVIVPPSVTKLVLAFVSPTIPSKMFPVAGLATLPPIFAFSGFFVWVRSFSVGRVKTTTSGKPELCDFGTRLNALLTSANT